MATIIEVNGTNIHYKLEGPQNGPTIVFSNSLGTDMRIWDDVISHLPKILGYFDMTKEGMDYLTVQNHLTLWEL